MLSCFTTPIIITQEFGKDFLRNGNYYYKQFGLLGHNGLDVVPSGDDIGIYNFFSGKIIKIEYHVAYGNRIVIWNKETRLMEYHNHLKFVNKQLVSGNLITACTYLGDMGNTGKSFGAHDHIAFRKTTEKGYITNLENGYNGYVNPVDYL
jgi:murein DD-endopeptidase MepM/ murein hydrolase activator NlpD